MNKIYNYHINNLTKSWIVSAMYHCRYMEFCWKKRHHRTYILMYHRFSQKKSPFKIQSSVFDQQLRFLSKKFTIISLDKYIELLDFAPDALPEHPLILTIDDGYADNYHYAYPVIKKYAVPATIFLSTDFVEHRAWLWSNRLEYILRQTRGVNFSLPLGGETHQFSVGSFAGWHEAQLAIFNHCRRLLDEEKDQFLDELSRKLRVVVPSCSTDDFAPLTWEQVREMQGNGVHFGSHTCSHPILSRVEPGALVHELGDSKQQIEGQIDAEVRAFCYPNGAPEDMNQAVVQAVQEHGYAAAVTTSTGYNDNAALNRFLLKRMCWLSGNKPHFMREVTRK
jgi:peptidoglycan/xylan/chitin deacetylase (PgdA/CDA1 family)